MRMRWTWGVALAAGLLGQGGTALAQQFMPSPVGAARMIPEPLPCGEATPNLVPGPISPLAAPPGPPDALSLPADRPNAFPCDTFPPDEHCYIHVGAVGLLRGDHLGAGGIAVLEPQSLKTGISPPTGQPLVQRYKDISQNMNFGVQATVGYLFNDTEAIELTGFYIASNYNSIDSQIPGQIDVFFFNAPPGFGVDNSLFLQADHLHTTFTQRTASAELNYRYTDKAITGAELILGLRYLDQRENLSIFTGANDLIAPDPTLQATYFVEAENRMILPQIGFEYDKPCTSWFTLGVTAKAAVGINLIEVQTKLTRGDGLVGFNNNRKEYSCGQVYDVGGFVDINPLERMHLRLGYHALWLAGVATAVDNLDFNLSNPEGRRSRYGSIFYHGPAIEFQFLF